MSGAARSIYVFGIYMIINGLTFMTIPNVILPKVHLPIEHSPWVRVGATLVAILGWYYIVAARNELTPFIRATILGRVLVMAAFIVYAVLGLADWHMVAFGIPDQLGALWTYRELRKESVKT